MSKIQDGLAVENEGTQIFLCHEGKRIAKRGLLTGVDSAGARRRGTRPELSGSDSHRALRRLGGIMSVAASLRGAMWGSTTLGASI